MCDCTSRSYVYTYSKRLPLTLTYCESTLSSTMTNDFCTYYFCPSHSLYSPYCGLCVRVWVLVVLCGAIQHLVHNSTSNLEKKMFMAPLLCLFLLLLLSLLLQCFAYHFDSRTERKKIAQYVYELSTNAYNKNTKNVSLFSAGNLWTKWKITCVIDSRRHFGTN